jgi:hypothetical protein
MHRESALIDGDERATRAFAFAFSGADRHPNVIKVHATATWTSRDLTRATVRAFQQVGRYRAGAVVRARRPRRSRRLPRGRDRDALVMSRGQDRRPALAREVG